MVVLVSSAAPMLGSFFGHFSQWLASKPDWQRDIIVALIISAILAFLGALWKLGRYVWRVAHHVPLDLGVATTRAWQGERDIQVDVYLVNRSKENRVALEFSLVRILQESRRRHIVCEPRDLGELKDSLGPQEHTRGWIRFDWAHPVEPADEYHLQIKDTITGAVIERKVGVGDRLPDNE